MKHDGQQSVVVVGGGVIGIACAHYLDLAGFRVTVIDKGRIAEECSYANCGYICPSHVPPLTEPGAFRVAIKSLFNPRSPFRVKPSLSPTMLQWMWQFAKRCNAEQVLWAGRHLQTILDASIAEYRQLISNLALDCEWKEDGLLYVFRSKHAFDEFAQLDRMLSEHFDVTARPLRGQELAEFEPGLNTGLYGAFHYPGDASVRPDLLNSAWRRQLSQRGVEFVENCALHAVDYGPQGIKLLQTQNGTQSADHYVFAMGAISGQWSKKLRLTLPVQPGKGYSVTLPRPSACPTHPMLFPEEKVGVSPFENGMRLGSMMEFVGYDETIPPHRISQLREAARPYLRASVDGVADETWFGWRPMTWDSLPIIGPLPKTNNAYLATGHNMIGLTLAPATGKLIAELVSGQPPHIDPSPYAPTRF